MPSRTRPCLLLEGLWQPEAHGPQLGIDLILDIGASCSSDLQKDLCGTLAFEQLFLLDNRYFVGKLDELRRPGDDIYDYRETEGGHSWR